MIRLWFFENSGDAYSLYTLKCIQSSSICRIEPRNSVNNQQLQSYTMASAAIYVVAVTANGDCARVDIAGQIQDEHEFDYQQKSEQHVNKPNIYMDIDRSHVHTRLKLQQAAKLVPTPPIAPFVCIVMHHPSIHSLLSVSLCWFHSLLIVDVVASDVVCFGFWCRFGEKHWSWTVPNPSLAWRIDKTCLLHLGWVQLRIPPHQVACTSTAQTILITSNSISWSRAPYYHMHVFVMMLSMSVCRMCYTRAQFAPASIAIAIIRNSFNNCFDLQNDGYTKCAPHVHAVRMVCSYSSSCVDARDDECG